MKKRLAFLSRLEKNNNKEWFANHKAEFDSIQKENKKFFEQIFAQLGETDQLSKLHIVRIHRDLRFAKEKIPYKSYFGASFSRVKPMLRGGYYIHLEPHKSFVGGGFWAPNSDDLYRIRKEIARDDRELKAIVENANFQRYFGEITGEYGVKTAPKGFDKNHPSIDLIRRKQFILKRNFTDAEICADNFEEEVLQTLLAVRPFFDYMTEILTTDENGTPLYA